MDVSHLAPALLSLSEVVKAANLLANGEKAAVKILINADLEQKCFEINVELALTIWEQAKGLIDDENLSTAKEIAEWIGITGSSVGLFQLIKWLKGKKIVSVVDVKLENGREAVHIHVEGQADPVAISKVAYDLYSDMNIRSKAVEVLAPLREDGYDSVQFYKGDDVFVEFKKDDVPETDGSDLPEVTPQNRHTSTIRTTVPIRKAAYEGTSRWTLFYQRAIEASIEDTEWLNSFQAGQESAPPGSSLDVEMEEVYITNENGEMIRDPSYRVVKVHKVVLSPKQMAFFEDPPS